MIDGDEDGDDERNGGGQNLRSLWVFTNRA
jgi:hypothetical protein